MSAKKMQLTWNEFHSDARALCERLDGRGPFRAIVSVTRGGLAPAAILARELDIRVIETLSVTSYDETKARGAARILKPIGADVDAREGEGLLVVDDLVDSGETAKLVRALLPKAVIAVVYAKPAGLPYADVFARETPQDTWIEFPWDL